MVRMSAVPGLTQIAHGEEPAPAKALIDFPLESIPPLPEDHPRYESRLETRIKYEAQNAANQVQRYNIFMQLSTGLFASLYISAKETNPLFAKLLYEACDYRRLDITDGSFDGALAFKMAHTRLFGASRTNADVEFYNVARDIQKKARLPDGCRSSDFVKKAHAWIHITYAPICNNRIRTQTQRNSSSK